MDYEGPVFGGFLGAGFLVIGGVLLLAGLALKPIQRGARRERRQW